MYVNGVAQAEENLTSIAAITRMKLILEGKSDTCFYGIDDLKIYEGVYAYNQTALSVSEDSGRFLILNTHIPEGSIVLMDSDVTKSEILSLAESPLSATLYVDNSFSAESQTPGIGNVMVVTDGQGMYSYYTIKPELLLTPAYTASETPGMRTLTLGIEYNGVSEEKNVTVFVGQYKEGRLIGVSLSAIEDFGEENQAVMTVAADADEQKAFIWATDKMIPLVPATPVAIS